MHNFKSLLYNSPFVFLCFLLACQTPSIPIVNAPSPELTAESVIFSQLIALQNNNKPEPDSGIAFVYAFASSNFSLSDNLETFSQQMHSNNYNILINCKTFDIHKHFEDLYEAQYFVEVESNEGRNAKFIFELSRSKENIDCRNCWLTEAIILMKPSKLKRKKDDESRQI